MALASLFNVQLPQERLSPSCILGIERAVMPMLDSYIYGGNRVSELRDKILLLVQVLGEAGQFWPLSKVVSEDIGLALKMSDIRFEKEHGQHHDWGQEAHKQDAPGETFDWLEPSDVKQEDEHQTDQDSRLELKQEVGSV